MSISCDCSCVDAGEWSGFVKSKEVKARKAHRCCECGDIIKQGEIYEVTDGCWDGSWNHFTTCRFCVMLRDTHCPGGYIYGELVETISECFGFWYPTDPATWDDEPREPAAWQLRALAE